MSKIGKKPIAIPQGIEVKVQGSKVQVKGSKGELELEVPETVIVKIDENMVNVQVKNQADRKQVALWGTFRALIQNMISGVEKGFERKLEINGVGYRAAVAGEKLTLNLGYSHPVELTIPKGLEVKVEKNVVTVSGIDKQAVGQFAAEIRSIRPPEPYKGKGVKYDDEVIRRKAGKVVKAVGGGE